jgi:hypothetical protein
MSIYIRDTTLASQYKPSQYIFVTATKRDTGLVALAGKLSTSECSVEVLFWDDLWIELQKSPEIFERYYGWSLHRPVRWWELPWFLLFLGCASAVGGAVWTVLWRKLGGVAEPHGLAAILWPLITCLPVCVICWLYSRREGVSLAETTRFLIGLAIGSSLFYDLPLGQYKGVRHAIEAWQWSPANTEALMVLIWSTTLVTFAHLFAVIGRPLFVKSLAHEARRRCIAVLTAVSTACVPVWIYVFIFPTNDSETGRGVIAGIALRVGLGLSLAMPLLEVIKLRYRLELTDKLESVHGDLQ